MSSARRELVSTTTRGLFRDLMTDSTVNIIATAFQDEGFPPDPDCTYEDTSVRRVTAQEHMDLINWSDATHVARALVTWA